MKSSRPRIGWVFIYNRMARFERYLENFNEEIVEKYKKDLPFPLPKSN